MHDASKLSTGITGLHARNVGCDNLPGAQLPLGGSVCVHWKLDKLCKKKSRITNT